MSARDRHRPWFRQTDPIARAALCQAGVIAVPPPVSDESIKMLDAIFPSHPDWTVATTEDPEWLTKLARLMRLPAGDLVPQRRTPTYYDPLWPQWWPRGVR